MALIQRKNLSTPRDRQTVYYSDFPTNLDIVPGTDRLMAVENVDAVKSAIKNIVLTNRFERFFDSDKGCDVRKLLFENIEPATEAAIKSTIVSAIENYEPRAKLIDVIVSGQPDINAYTISIVFATINTVQPETLELILTRIR